ncbi:MAG: dienelactone hydrolase family protein [Fimbriimonadaceae bacterium]|nr:dienelactone hydrolase family protein [Fimbriimonadaceae bacterium]
MGEMIRFSRHEQEFQGYLVGDSGPGVILIQEWWGLVDHIKCVADRLADEGFVVLAPDFYDGQQTTEPDEAGSLMMALNIARAAEMVQGGVDFLLGDDRVDGEKVGVVGFCMGGKLAMYAATLHPHIGAAANFYGIHPHVHPNYQKLHAPVLGIFAENDEYASPEAVRELSAQLTALGKEHDFHTYAGVSHAFFNDDRPEVYDGEAAMDAWQKLLAFFRQNLT